ncbi:hypothetical protein F5884DRAFT_749934 [Xylogone sp. PMI_703]|nr:hypothetical protein F5884DRAFT_749934 [Xylogone sp. PMI_703]
MSTKRAESRPPVTTRWRTSFDLKRNRSFGKADKPVVAPTPDPDLLRTAIERAIGSDEFQASIAKHLAKIIEPSIKSALDIIQPVVETVYEHELLLRKGDGVESVLLRLESGIEEERAKLGGDDKEDYKPVTNGFGDVRRHSMGLERFKELLTQQQEDNARKLSELTNDLEITNDRFTEVVSGIAGLGSALSPTTDLASTLRTFSEQTRSSMSVMQAQLDQLKSDSWAIISAMGPELGQDLKDIQRTLSAHSQSPSLEKYSTKLDAISSELQSLRKSQESPETRELLKEITTSLDLIRESIDQSMAADAEDTATLMAALDKVQRFQTSHATALEEIRSASAHGSNDQILAALERSNNSHASHAVILEELRDDSRQNVGQDILGAIERLQASPPSHSEASQHNINEEILATLQRLTESHASHTALLEDIRNSSVNEEILSAFEKLSEFHIAHSEALEDIKNSGNADLNGEILAALEKLSELHAAQSESLNEIKSATKSNGNEEIMSGLQKLKNALEKLNEAYATRDVGNAAAQGSNEEVLKGLEKLNESFAAHDKVLEEIRGARRSNGITADNIEILAALERLNESHATHTTALEALKHAAAPQQGIPVDNGKLEAMDSKVDEIITTLNSHSTKLDGIKVSATPRSPSPTVSETTTVVDILQPKVETIITAMDNQAKVLAEQSNLLLDIKNSDVSAEILTVLRESCDTQASHAQSLAELKESDMSDEILTAIHNCAEAIQNSSQELKDIKEGVERSNDAHASHAADLAEVKNGINASNEAHESHAAAFDTLNQTRSAPATDNKSVDGGSLDSQLRAINDTLENHTYVLTSIKDATDESNKSHASHAALLQQVKSLATIPGPELLDALQKTYDLLQTHFATVSSKDTIYDDLLHNLVTMRSIIEESKADIHGTREEVTSLHEDHRSATWEILSAVQTLATPEIISAQGKSGEGRAVPVGTVTEPESKISATPVEAVTEPQTQKSTAGVHDELNGGATEEKAELHNTAETHGQADSVRNKEAATDEQAAEQSEMTDLAKEEDADAVGSNNSEVGLEAVKEEREEETEVKEDQKKKKKKKGKGPK